MGRDAVTKLETSRGMFSANRRGLMRYPGVKYPMQRKQFPLKSPLSIELDDDAQDRLYVRLPNGKVGGDNVGENFYGNGELKRYGWQPYRGMSHAFRNLAEHHLDLYDPHRSQLLNEMPRMLEADRAGELLRDRWRFANHTRRRRDEAGRLAEALREAAARFTETQKGPMGKGKVKKATSWNRMLKHERQRLRQQDADAAWRQNTGAGPSRPPVVPLSGSAGSGTGGSGSASSSAASVGSRPTGSKRASNRSRKHARPAKRPRKK